MPKSYLITLSETDLQTLVFSAVDRAIKLNKLSGNYQEIANKNSAVIKKTAIQPSKQLAHG